MFSPATRASVALVLALAGGPALAQVACTGSGVNFSLGAYTVENPVPADSSVTFTVTCSRSGGPRNVNVEVGIGPSLHTGSVATRSMKHLTNSDLLAYNLFRDAAMSQVWGDTAGVNTMTQTIQLQNRSTGSVSFTIFGRIPALQDVRAGAYADQLTITVMP